MTSSESADLFARSWSLYDHITEHNYMFHQEIYAELSELLKQRHDAGQYHMLDLGCGNARYLVPAPHGVLARPLSRCRPLPNRPR